MSWTFLKYEFNEKYQLMLLKLHTLYLLTFFENFYFLFKSFVKVVLSYNLFTIKMFSTAENCMEK